jgi:heme/copper-type cytochrome/quinol oxidase subunit 1
MNDIQSSAAPVWPYVLIGGMVKIACASLAYWYTAISGREVDLGSMTATILAVGAGLAWYSHRVNRPMQRHELLRFASGVALTDLLLSLTLIVGSIVWVGEPISTRNISLVLTGREGLAGVKDLAALGAVFVFAALTVFGLSLLVAWAVTRKLPMRRKGTSTASDS